MPAKKKATTKSRPVEGQKKRVPLHQARDKLKVKNLCPKDHVDRWVSDGMSSDPHRIQRFLDAGWKLVLKDGGTVGDRTVSSADSTSSFVTHKDVTGLLYYMVIHKDFYDADQVDKQKTVDESEESIKAAAEAEGMYGKITLS